MKIGSLVVVKPFSHVSHLPHLLSFIKWQPIDDEKTIYTVRGFKIEGRDRGVYFEEGVMGYHPNLGEISLWDGWVREVQPPVSSEELMTVLETNEVLV